MSLARLYKRMWQQVNAKAQPRRGPQSRRSCPLQLEELESRLVPSSTEVFTPSAAASAAPQPTSHPVHTTVFTVTSTGDDPGTLAPPTTTSGPNFTLRDAILGANATGGPAKIVFDLGTAGPQNIELQAALPTLVNDNTTIDGTSEPGWSGVPLVQIIPNSQSSVGRRAGIGHQCERLHHQGIGDWGGG